MNVMSILDKILGFEFPENMIYLFAFFIIGSIIILVKMALRSRSIHKSNSRAVRSRADLKEAIRSGVDLDEQKKKDTKNLLVCPKCGIYGNSSNLCPECGLKL